MTTLFDFLTSQAEDRGDDSAYLFLNDGVERWDVTYGELYRRVLGNAAAIAAHAGPGDRAVLVCPPGPEFVVGYFACLAALGVREIRAIVLVDGQTQSALEAANVVLEEVGVLIEIDGLERELS